MTSTLRAGLAALALVAVLGACRARDAGPSPEPSPTLRSDVSVTEITLGSAIGSDRRVKQAGDTFAPSETVYASVVTQGAGGRGRLQARWTDQAGKVVAESAVDIAPDTTTVSEFHISRPNGLAPGAYQVEIFMDGASAGKRSFSVH